MSRGQRVKKITSNRHLEDEIGDEATVEPVTVKADHDDDDIDHIITPKDKTLGTIGGIVLA